ncbi:ABC transporter ATP-binding protein [Mucilaginibacter auburnensis]|uniref:Lipopolysaccharide transport system ATP-binding protein n=1 Tax=Mucilaginibacter auburnensis TaxID=1457233 RepID=A0A2H9VM89_9SPHI|nr:ABC transporter ATP-binding protein [Mucilaginibacter auburnensis]PJJ79451.1 lipopolysaccharide transport system ATP-binding protein [Mucilaginibacter auburnensis]
MMPTVIKVENLSKAYQLGNFGTGTISRDLERAWARFRGKEDPFTRIGETNDRSVKGTSDIVWSLKDINFDIKQGDAVGIIGRNGAGKSTLLKLLSRVTSPTTGSIKIKGRIASLLEVGTGFHPELTGRENIYLNGAILGMRKAEIKRKFDEIVDFSGVERYIDTPVKRYSSGMYVRLAFAVAAHLESEILIVDEVLAVGDAEFQKKCLGKMGDVSKGEGRTVLFVSHNIGSVKSLCTHGIVLNNGMINCFEPINKAIQAYNNQLKATENIKSLFRGNISYKFQFHKVKINKGLDENCLIDINDPISIEIDGTANEMIKRVVFMVAVYQDGTRLFTLREYPDGRMVEKGDFTAEFKIKPRVLRPGEYTIAVGCWGNNEDEWVWGTDVALFTVTGLWTESIRKSDEGIINGEFLRLE